MKTLKDLYENELGDAISGKLTGKKNSFSSKIAGDKYTIDGEEVFIDKHRTLIKVNELDDALKLAYIYKYFKGVDIYKSADGKSYITDIRK